MRAVFCRGACLLLLFIMLFSIQPAAFGEELEEFGLVEEGQAPQEIVIGGEEAEDAVLLDEAESPAPVIVIEDAGLPDGAALRDAGAESFQAAEDAQDRVRFAGHALVLGDRIGLAFRLHVPAALRRDSFMRFTGAGEEQLCGIPDTPDADGLFRFVCWLSPLQLADEITPVFCRGDMRLRGAAFSVRAFLEEMQEEENLRPLLYAVGNYGHYAERCFAEGEPQMPRWGEEEYDYARIRGAIEGLRMQWRPVGLVENVRPLLRVDPDARLYLKVSMYNGFPRLPELSAYGIGLEADEKGSFELAAVKLNGLGTMLDVVMSDAGQSAAIRVSALSMAYDVLEPGGIYTPEQQDFCAALCTLFEAVTAYTEEG